MSNMRLSTFTIAVVALTGVYGQGVIDSSMMCGARTDGGFPTWCPTEYVPVCALCPGDKLTNYMNMCFFNAARCDRAREDWCELKHHGSCTDYDTHVHNKCATLYNPVCTECGESKTLRSFINECYYYQYNDENPTYKQCTFKSSGECKPAGPVPTSPKNPIPNPPSNDNGAAVAITQEEQPAPVA